MKTRQGFVSNSSSASFVILAKDEDIKASLKTLSPIGKKFISDYFVSGGKKVIVDKKEYKLCFGTSYNDAWPIHGETDANGKLFGFESEEEAWEQIKCFKRNVKPICIIEEY